MYRTYFKPNKYNARKTTYEGIRYDSGFEAEVAAELDLRKKAGEILSWERQYKLEMWCYTEDGQKAFKVSHKVDFLVHHHDGSKELVEAKGIETDDYKWRRKFLENVWLKEHPEYTYTVIKKQGRGGYGRK